MLNAQQQVRVPWAIEDDHTDVLFHRRCSTLANEPPSVSRIGQNVQPFFGNGDISSGNLVKDSFNLSYKIHARIARIFIRQVVMLCDITVNILVVFRVSLLDFAFNVIHIRIWHIKI